MIRVALVGNIASGKSTVEKILIKKGFPVLDTDVVCHNLLSEEQDSIKELFKEFDILDSDGNISRDKLGKLVFNNSELRLKLESFMHPLVRVKISEFFSLHKKDGVAFVAIPLLFEAKMMDLFDKILFVYSNDELRLERLIKRNNYSREYAQVRIDSQIPQDDKISRSDFVIYNNSSLEELENNVIRVIEQIH